MASALVLFVILVGVVTLKTWPHAGALLGNRGSDVALERTATPAPQTSAGSSSLNVVKLLGGSRTVAPHEDAGRGRQGGAGGGSSPGPGLSDGVSQGAEPTPPASSRPSDPVSQLLSGAGNTVRGGTESLGNTLGGSSSQGLGGVVGGLGQTLNDTLQGLAGKR